MKKIVVFGSFVCDLVARMNRFPVAGESVVGNSFNTFLGGKGANQCMTINRLNGNVTMIGKVGNDLFGDNFINEFKKEGLNTNYIFRSDKSTGVGCVQIEESGQNRICIVLGANLDFNNNDALMQNIEQLNITSAGYFDIIPKDNLVVTPLFSSGSDSGIFSLETVLENNNPITLKQKYIPDDKDYILALRVTGSPLSTYNKLLKSSNPVDILIFADTDILYDQFWILPNNGAFADNGDMILNALETLSDAPSLADLRAKQKQPLDVILIKKTNEKTILSIIALVPSPALLLILWIIYLWKRKLKNDKK